MCRRRGYIDSFEWKDTDAADTLLKKFFVSPRRLGKIAPYAADTKAYRDYPTIAGRVATMFSQWSGTIVYTFHFVKTQSHSGRIRLSFRPGNRGDETDIKDMIGYGFSSVVDLSAGTTVSFRAYIWLHAVRSRFLCGWDIVWVRCGDCCSGYVGGGVGDELYRWGGVRFVGYVYARLVDGVWNHWGGVAWF